MCRVLFLLILVLVGVRACTEKMVTPSFTTCGYEKCVTCCAIVATTSFVSVSNKQKFGGKYSFGADEKAEINCRSTNIVYMISCNICGVQYIGETIQTLYSRMSQHRTSAKTGRSGNFRIREHYHQKERCKWKKGKAQFAIYILEKLPGNGRKEDKDTTICEVERKNRVFQQDQWVRKFHCLYPYGLNDRLDSLQNKNRFNCEYAKFLSHRSDRKRSWSKKSVEVDCPEVACYLFSLVGKDFNPGITTMVKRKLVDIKKDKMLEIKNDFLMKCSTLNGYESCQTFKLILDLLVFKTEPIQENVKKTRKRSCLSSNITFISKGVEMLNLPRLYNKLTSTVTCCKSKVPMVTYNYLAPISRKLLNYKETVCASDDHITCKCELHPSFVEGSCGHVLTGNMDIFKNEQLKEVCMKGLSYREPRTIDFRKIRKSVMEDIKKFISIWSSKEGLPESTFNEWLVEFEKLLDEQIEILKKRYRYKLVKHSSVFNDASVKEELDYFHQNFVLCPVDKAPKNLAVICKRYYLDTLYKECNSSSDRFEIVEKSVDDVVEVQKKYMGDVGLGPGNVTLPYMFMFPKFHKKEMSQRFVVSYSSCAVKPLAEKITLGLKAVQYQIVSYCRMMLILTGIKRNWIIESNAPILECIENIKDARNITTYDFSTLYTNFSLADIETALTGVIKLAFKHSKKSFISVYKKSFQWTDTPRKNTFRFTEVSLIQSIVWLLNNSYLTICENIFRQLIGVPIGVNCGPLIANLTLFFFENRHLESLYKLDYKAAKKLCNTFRLIDDISSINSDGIFEEHYSKIYPESLVLKKENTGNQQADILDLSINIGETPGSGTSFCVKVYDKRDDFKFKVSDLQYIDSNISLNCAYGIYKSQMIRYFRICSHLSFFIDRVNILSKNLVSKGYKPERLKSIFSKFVLDKTFKSKFKDYCKDNWVLDF